MNFSTKVVSNHSNHFLASLEKVLPLTGTDSKFKYLIVPLALATITYLIDKHLWPGNKQGVSLSQYLGWITGWMFWMIVLDTKKNQ